VRYVHRQIGVWVPRTVQDQYAYARNLSPREIQAGDLVFFAVDKGNGRHVGIYEGAGRFIHAPSSGKRVGRASLYDPYWRARLVGAGSYL
jgi:cell wall-associated NlpC family hydrolase